MAKYVDIILRAYAAEKSVDDFIDRYWRDVLNQQPPVRFELSFEGTGVPGSGNFERWINSRKVAGKFIEPFLSASSRMARLPAGFTPGRVALIGFSAGCGAIKALLNSPADAPLVDFAYFCDGLHAMWDNRRGEPGFSARERFDNPRAASSYISPHGLDGVVEYGKRAALGKGPCLLITHSQIVPKYPSTTETALYVEDRINAELGGEQSKGGINPVGFLGVGPTAPQPPKMHDNIGYWPSSWNPGSCPNRKAEIHGPWPVDTSYVRGWAVRVGFDAHDGLNPKCEARTNSQPAHIFQANWVQLEAMRHILAKKWKVECTSGALEGLAPPGWAVNAQKVMALSQRLQGGMSRQAAHLARVVDAPYPVGLGGGEVCFQSGVFLNKFTSDDVMRAKLTMLGYGAVALAVVGGGYYLWKTR